jgi:hypothetical protein
VFHQPISGSPSRFTLGPIQPKLQRKGMAFNSYRIYCEGSDEIPFPICSCFFRESQRVRILSPTDYQKSVGNFWLDFANLCRWTGGIGKQEV